MNREEEIQRGRLAERARCRQIICSPEAKGREGLARRLALDSDLEPEQARKLLAASPRQIAGPFAKMFQEDGSDSAREVQAVLRVAQGLQFKKEEE